MKAIAITRAGCVAAKATADFGINGVNGNGVHRHQNVMALSNGLRRYRCGSR